MITNQIDHIVAQKYRQEIIDLMGSIKLSLNLLPVNDLITIFNSLQYINLNRKGRK